MASWTETGDLNTAKLCCGGGTYTSVASSGDQYTGVSESWAGSTWTSITSHLMVLTEQQELITKN